MAEPRSLRIEKLQSLIRDVPDFPKPGILFKDITPVLEWPDSFKEAVDLMADSLSDLDFTKFCAIESRGFIFASALAQKLEKGVVLVRKKGKLPWKTHRVDYDLEYGQDSLFMHQDALEKGERVVIVDDLLATGGTAGATIDLVHTFEAKVLAMSFFIELRFLNGREKLKGLPVHTVIQY